MAKTVVGLFDSFAEAQRVVQDLIDNGFRRDDISVVANDRVRREYAEREVGSDSKAGEGAGAGAVGGTVVGGAVGLLIGAGLLAIPGIGPVLAAGPLAAAIGTTAATVGAGALGAGIGAAAGGLIGGLVGAGIPEDEAGYYAEGVRRGGTLVAVSADDRNAGTARDIMQRYNAVDIDERASQWRQSGWAGFDPNAEPYDDTSRDSARRDTAPRGAATDRPRADAGGETVLPVVEEEVDIDKRRVEQGGVRVSSHIEERPVERDVNLREERVNVERRPADRPLTDADRDAFQSRDFTVRETSEEPVVRKRARVIEEVVIDKDVTERTETVRDTARRTDVQIDKAAGRGASFDDEGYRRHYDQRYAAGGYGYDDYRPGYRYGESLAQDERYRGREWREVEPEARRLWERQNPGTWEEFKDGVQHAWDKARGRR